MDLISFGPLKKINTMRLFFTILITITMYHAKGQSSVHFAVGAEKTATRCLYGGSLTVETKGKWGIGAFYQAGIPSDAKESLKLNDAFYGVLFQVPLAKTQKIDFFATARAGLVNEDFFVVVPGLETRIKIWRKLSTVFSMGYRVGYPAIGLKLSHPLF